MLDLILGGISINTELAFSSISADQGMSDSCLNNYLGKLGGL